MMKSMTEKVNSIIHQVFHLLQKGEQEDYIGESISQLQHALQCAQLAIENRGSPDLILASLFHDLGHLCAPPHASHMDQFGIDNHHRLGADWLRSVGFSEKIALLVEGHVVAKRYLVSKNPKYYNQLSLASVETLKRQGGEMSVKEVTEFENFPHFHDILRLRFFDDRAKRLGWKVPPLESYRILVHSHLSNQKSIRSQEIFG